MSDEQIEIEPIVFTQHSFATVEQWPARTTLTEVFLKKLAPRYGATVEGDVVTFVLGNGTASYRLRRDLPLVGSGIVADLIVGDDATGLKRRARKFYEAEPVVEDTTVVGRG